MTTQNTHPFLRGVAVVPLTLAAVAGPLVWITDMWRSNLSRVDVIEISAMLFLLVIYTLAIIYCWLWPRRRTTSDDAE